MIIDLPKLGPVNFRDDLTQEQFQAQLSALQQKYDFKLPKPEVGIGTLLKRGLPATYIHMQTVAWEKQVSL